MKNHLVKAIIAIVALVAVPQLQAYRYPFSNHTKKTVAVAIKFQGSKWYEFAVVQPGRMGTIGHGNKYIPNVQTEMSSSSAGLVPSQIFYYIPKAGEQMTTQNQQTVAWKAINITWVPSEAYDMAIELADRVGKFTEKAGTTAAKAGAAYMSGGATAVAEGAAKATGGADALKAASEGKYGLGKLLSAIGKSASRSLIGDRHFDIVEDETGKISIISLL